jgi:hypothetical protein
MRQASSMKSRRRQSQHQHMCSITDEWVLIKAIYQFKFLFKKYYGKKSTHVSKDLCRIAALRI